MTTVVALPTGSYVDRDPRSSGKRLVNCFSQINPQTAPADSKTPVPPITIRRAPGITSLIAAYLPQDVAPVLNSDGNWTSSATPNNFVGQTLTQEYALGATQQPANNPAIVGMFHVLCNGAPSQFLASYAGLGCTVYSVPCSAGPSVVGYTNEYLVVAVCRVNSTDSFTGDTFTLRAVGTNNAACYGFSAACANYVAPITEINSSIVNVNGTTTPWSMTVPAVESQAGDMVLSVCCSSNSQTSQLAASGAFTTENTANAVNATLLATAWTTTTAAEDYAVDWSLSPSENVPTNVFFAISLNLPARNSTTQLSVAVRGMSTMAGVTYVVIGSGLYSLTSSYLPYSGTSYNLTFIATGITGSGFVRMANNGACLFILLPNSTIGYTYTTANGLEICSAAGFTSYGAIDVKFCDSYLVFLAMNGEEMFNDDGKASSGTGPVTFNSGSVFPREFGTDLFAGMEVDHREVVLFGVQTTEGYLNAGNAVGDPFSSVPGSFMEIGIEPSTGYCVCKQDQAIFFIANDRTVRRRNGQTPDRVSNSGIEAILETIDMTGSYAMTPSIGGHPLVIFTFPAPTAQRTLVYDCLTTEWFELESLGFGNWRPLCYYNALGLQLVGDSTSSQIGYLDTTAFSEFGNVMRSYFTTQSIFDNHNRITHRRLELVVTVGGAGTLTPMTTSHTISNSGHSETVYTTSLVPTAPMVTLYVSDDSGQTWRARETKPLGLLGQRKARVVWWNLGTSRDRTYKFQISDAAPTYTVAILAELHGGKW